MSTSVELSHCSNICADCPAAIALGFRTDELASTSPDPTISEARLAMQKGESQVAASALDTAAGQTACKDIVKELPPPPDTIPAIGTQELIDYVSACPSFPTYVSLRTSSL